MSTNEQPPVPRLDLTDDVLEQIWDVCEPTTETEMLKVAALYPGIDPYAVASGAVRGVAVDRWCNNLLRVGFIVGWEDDDTGDIWIWATDKGKEAVGI